jgi:hypothetical protein
MAICFRLRGDICARSAISSDQSELVLTSVTNGDDLDVILKRADGVGPLSQARRIAVVGRAFDDEASAAAAGMRWRGFVEAAFSAMHLAVDFGDRAAKGFVTDIGLEMTSQALGDTPTLNDVHGLMVYNDEPQPRLFATGPAIATQSQNGSAVIRTVQEAMRRNIVRTEAEHVAYDLFSASFNTAGVVDARFIMLMMAVEAMLVQEPRSPEAVVLVEELRARVEASTLSRSDKASLRGGMAYLHQESISKSGRRLARTLGNQPRYTLGPDGRGQEKPVDFFQDSYSMRSSLVHGEGERPSYTAVALRGASLEQFVADLLSIGLDGFHFWEVPDEDGPNESVSDESVPDAPTPDDTGPASTTPLGRVGQTIRSLAQRAWRLRPAPGQQDQPTRRRWRRPRRR